MLLDMLVDHLQYGCSELKWWRQAINFNDYSGSIIINLHFNPGYINQVWQPEPQDSYNITKDPSQPPRQVHLKLVRKNYEAFVWLRKDSQSGSNGLWINWID